MRLVWVGGWIDVERGRLQDSTLDKSPYLEKSPKSPFANVKPTSVLTAPSTSYLPIICRLVSSCVLLFQKLFIFLQAKRKWSMLGLKPRKRLPQKHD